MTIAPEAPKVQAKGKNLPISKVTAQGSLMPTVATIEISQEFINGNEPADVTYHCPLYPDWAVRNVTMRAGDIEVQTTVLSTEKAQETFDQAKDAGHTAIMADEAATDDLRLQLANVPANATVEVITEIVAWPMVEDNTGCYIIPLISGPKYNGTEAQQPYIDPDDIDAKHTACHLDLDIDMDDAKIDIGTIEDGKVSGEIEPVGQVAISFSTKPHALWHQDDSGSYLTIGVPAIRPENAPEWGNVALLIDRSGSMGGQGMSVASTFARGIVEKIGDSVKHIYAFNNTCEPVWSAGKAVRRRGRTDLSATDVIAHISSSGGTEINKALHRVYNDVKDEITDVVMITDVLVSERDCGDIVRSARQLTENGIAVHIAVVGASPGRFVGEAISYAGGGFYIEQTGSTFDENEIEDCVERFLQGGSTLDGIDVDGEFFTCKHPVRGRPVMVAYDADDKPSSVKVKMNGYAPIDVPIDDHPEARFIWAREKVLELVRMAWSAGDKIGDSKEQIIKLGIDHQITTPYTAFVGFDPSNSQNRDDVQQVMAQASLPSGIDAGSFSGVYNGGSLGVRGMSMNLQAEQGVNMSANNDGLFKSASSTMCDWGDTTFPSVDDTTHTAATSPDEKWHSENSIGDVLGENKSVPDDKLGDVREQAATILAIILEAIENNDDPIIGDWIYDHSTLAIVIAATHLRSIGCVGLATELSQHIERNDIQKSSVEPTHLAHELEPIAHRIGKQMNV